MRKSSKGFTLIELLIVVAIIGIIAAIAIPNLLAALQRSKQKRTMQDMRTIAVAWEARATDLNRYNAAGVAVLDACSVPISQPVLAGALVPTYVKIIPAVDGWGNPWRFRVTNSFGGAVASNDYVVWSAGRDGSTDGSGGWQSTPPGGATTDFDADIIFSAGAFLQYPEGVQTQ